MYCVIIEGGMPDILLDILKDNRAYLTYQEAKKRLEHHFSSINMYYVLEALSSMGDVRRQAEYIRMWKEKGTDPDAFASAEVYIYQSMCRSRSLREAIRRASNRIITADMVATYYGKPSIAIRILRGIKDTDYGVRSYRSREFRDFIVDTVLTRARLYMGKEVDLSPLERYYELSEEVIKVYTLIFKFMAGEFDYEDVAESVLQRAFAKGSKAAILNLMRYKAFVELDIFKLELLKHTFTSLGDTFSALLSEIYLDFLTEKEPLSPFRIPEDCGFLRTHYLLMRKYRFGEDYEPPEDMTGIGDMWWYVNRRRNGRPYLSFAGKLRLYDGAKEVRFRSRRTVITLAYLKLLGREGLERNLDLVFPSVKNPKRRLYQALAQLGRYRHVPSDLKITLRRGNFLRDESEPWAEFLKRNVRGITVQ